MKSSCFKRIVILEPVISPASGNFKRLSFDAYFLVRILKKNGKSSKPSFLPSNPTANLRRDKTRPDKQLTELKLVGNEKNAATQTIYVN